MERESLLGATKQIAKADRIVAFTGAGISAGSGIPTFRGSQGLWSKYDPAEYAEITAFLSNPAKVWGMLKELIEVLDRARPNPAHFALAEMEQLNRMSCIITQNVDNLHQRAGSRNVIDYHGNHEKFSCLTCRTSFTRADVCLEKIPPRCSCGGILRPEVVFFGEEISPSARIAAEREAQQCQVMLVIGTSAVVYPAGGLPIMAKEAGAKIVEVNLEPTPLTGHVSEILLRGNAAEILPLLVEEVRNITGNPSV